MARRDRCQSRGFADVALPVAEISFCAMVLTWHFLSWRFFFFLRDCAGMSLPVTESTSRGGEFLFFLRDCPDVALPITEIFFLCDCADVAPSFVEVLTLRDDDVDFFFNKFLFACLICRDGLSSQITSGS